jgi:hypothetical protein
LENSKPFFSIHNICHRVKIFCAVLARFYIVEKTIFRYN